VERLRVRRMFCEMGVEILTFPVPEFTGISAPYEAPTSPEIHIKTDEVDVEGAVKIITEYLEKQGLLSGA
jgi:adenylylsulfate kinase-like enzyme